VATFLTERFPEPPLVLPGRRYVELVESSARTGLAGGAVYDALIAATARHANATLLTRDERAVVVYERMKVRFELVK
jgi:predicted nucleic acid-binding protein